MKVKMSVNLKNVLSKAGLIMPDDSRSVESLANLLGRLIANSKSMTEVEIMLFSKACAELERIADHLATLEYKEAVKNYEEAFC